MSRVLVTGGAGFIGSHLCERLSSDGFDVVCMDNYITGNKRNIAHLKGDGDIEFVEHDVSKFIEVEGELDFIMHFASPASPIDYLELPIQTLKVGSLGTHNALGLACAKKAVFFLASTSEVYGDPLIHPQPESYWGNVNPTGVRGCFSEDTEILTDSGWKSFQDVTKEDEILTLNKKGQIEYHKPGEIIKERYVGELIKFSNSKIDLVVTPNHKMYVRERNRKKFELVEAFNSIRWERAEMLKSGKWSGKEEKWFYLAKVRNAKSKQQEKINMDVWLEFFGYFITDGSTYLRHRKSTVNKREYVSKVYTVLISQSKKDPDKRDRIRKCLKRLGFKFYEENAQFRILSKQLYSYLAQFGKAKEKYVPREYLLLSKRQLLILFDAMMLGDGSWDGRKFYSSSLHLLGAMQELLLKLGMAGSIKLKDGKKGSYVVFILTDKKKDFLTPKYPKRAIEGYDGHVYCVNVPNHVIYVRRNGKAVWCGNCYDEAKRFAEAMTMAYHRVHGIDTKIVRIFNTYGSHMRAGDGRAIPAFINQAINNDQITVFGDGSQTRSFCYIDDLVEGIVRLMKSGENEPVNLGNPKEMTILELAEKIIEVTGSSSEMVFKELPVDDPKVRQPDITKARKLLGWEPTVSLKEGLSKTVEYFRNLK